MFEDINKLLLRLILLISFCVIGIVFMAQLVYELEPCVLCKFQRIPYFAVILFAGMGLHIRGTDQAGTLKVIGLIFITGAILAFYHNGIEQHWWNTLTSCGQTNKLPKSFENFQNQLMTAIPKRCDEVDWTLFGWSMTIYNFLLSVTLAVLSLSSKLFLKLIHQKI